MTKMTSAKFLERKIEITQPTTTTITNTTVTASTTAMEIHQLHMLAASCAAGAAPLSHVTHANLATPPARRTTQRQSSVFSVNRLREFQLTSICAPLIRLKCNVCTALSPRALL